MHEVGKPIGVEIAELDVSRIGDQRGRVLREDEMLVSCNELALLIEPVIGGAVAIARRRQRAHPVTADEGHLRQERPVTVPLVENLVTPDEDIVDTIAVEVLRAGAAGGRG